MNTPGANSLTESPQLPAATTVVTPAPKDIYRTGNIVFAKAGRVVVISSS